MGNALSQVFPPKPKFTEANVPNQSGKVFIITGASGGVGKELAQILYQQNAKIYVAARSSSKASAAIKAIQTAVPNSSGELIFLHLDLDDLTTIKKSAEEFLAKEDKLHILFNNAGVWLPPQGSTTKQGYESQIGVNNIAPHLFTKFLTPILIKTAEASKPGDVRVVWTSSSAAEMRSPKGGVEMDNLDYKIDKSPMFKYGVSKAGNIFQGTEFARRFGKTGVVSVSLNPGNLNSDLYRDVQGIKKFLLTKLLLHPSIYGAYTTLFAGLSPQVTVERNGAFIIPWGRFSPPISNGIEESIRTKAENGTGIAEAFWDWIEDQVKPYL